ncbi:MAG TPA: glycosyltransferase family 4 protein [Bdellovibrionales bacterium]|nr:glycosyltransferase family 4 protein [Bdellovibrionales bacterium]
MQKKKCPWVLWFDGSFEWPSHQYIIPSVVKMLERVPARVHRFKAEELDRKTAREIQEGASCLILIPPLNRGLQLLQQLRTQFGVHTPAILMETSHLNARGQVFFEYHEILTAADSFVACAQPGYELLKEALQGHKRVYRIPWPITAGDMGPVQPRVRAAFRRSLGLKPDDKMVVFSGRLTPQKNIHGLLHALKLAREKVPDIHLFLLGDFADEDSPYLGLVKRRDYAREILQLVRELGLQDYVHFKGNIWRRHLRFFMAAADVHASLTVYYREEFGFAVAEGLTCGAPTLVTAWGGGADAVLGGGAMGVPVDVGNNGPRADIRGAARALVELMEPKTNELWRRKALAYANSELRDERVAAKWRKLTAAYANPVRPRGTAEISTRLFETNFELIANWPVTHSGRVYWTPSDSYLKWVLGTYALGGVKLTKASKTYIHPGFDLKTGRLGEPIAFHREIKIAPRERADLKRHFGRDGRGSVSWSAIKDYAWAGRLRDAGVLLSF